MLDTMYDPLNSGFSSEPSDTPPWPTTPHTPNDPHPTLVKPNSPTPSSSSTGPFGREPQIYGQPEPGLISPTSNKATNGTKFERNEPYLRVRITGLDRNRRDILVRFDAQVGLQKLYISWERTTHGICRRTCLTLRVKRIGTSRGPTSSSNSFQNRSFIATLKPSSPPSPSLRPLHPRMMRVCILP
jgi:hypothetical protein